MISKSKKVKAKSRKGTSRVSQSQGNEQLESINIDLEIPVHNHENMQMFKHLEIINTFSRRRAVCCNASLRCHLSEEDSQSPRSFSRRHDVLPPCSE